MPGARTFLAATRALAQSIPPNILHVLRAPVGGLFRHVLDFMRGQMARGHNVGLIAADGTGGARADEAFAGDRAVAGARPFAHRHAAAALSAICSRSTMSFAASAEASADVVHGHGAKGGAYARLMIGHTRAVRAYTPHGGSLLFGHDTLAGQFYLTTERILDAARRFVPVRKRI